MSVKARMPFSAFTLILAALFLFSEPVVWAESAGLGMGSGRTPSLVFDPETKKYFIGGSARFMLRQSQDSSVIDRIEVSVDGGDYMEYSPQGIALKGEGKHTIKFRAINPVNDWSPVQFVELFLDLTPPSTETKFEEGKFYRKDNGSGDGAVYAALNSTLSFLAQDNLSGVARIEYSWESDTGFLPYSKPILIDKPGRRVLYYRSIDRVGNVEPTQKMTFIADGTSPNSELRISGGPLKPAVINGVSYLTARDNVSFGIEAVDEESGVREVLVSVNDKPASRYLKPLYFLQEGPHRLTYFAEDNVGNREAPKTVQIYSVSTAPRTVATPQGKVVTKGGVNYARRNLRLKLSAEDNVVGLDRIEFRVEPSPEYSVYVEPIRFDKIGDNVVVYRSVDRAGNTEPARHYKVVVTESAPETRAETNQPLVVREGITYSPSPNTVSLIAQASGIGVEKTLMSVNDGPFVPYTGPLAITSEQRLYKITFKSVDELGNEETPKTVTYHMIGSRPMVDMFVSDGMTMQEQVRTDFFDRQPAARPQAPVESRGVAPAPTGNAAPRAPKPRRKGP